MGGLQDGRHVASARAGHNPRARILQLRRHAVFRVDPAKVGSNRQTPWILALVLSVFHQLTRVLVRSPLRGALLFLSLYDFC